MTDPISGPGSVGGAHEAQKAHKTDSGNNLENKLAAALLAILSTLGGAVESKYLPMLEKAKGWQKAVDAIRAMLVSADPKALTNSEINEFADGFQFLQYYLKHPNKAPKGYSTLIKQLLDNKNFKAKFEKLYTDIKHLQELEKHPKQNKAAIDELLKKTIPGDVAALQEGKGSGEKGGGPTPIDKGGLIPINPPYKPESPEYREEVATATQFATTTEAVSNYWYQAANRMTANITSISNYAAGAVKQFQAVKSFISQQTVK